MAGAASFAASRYDRLTRDVQMSMASDMVNWCRPADTDGAVAQTQGVSSSVGDLGIVAKRAAANRSRRGRNAPAPPPAAAPSAAPAVSARSQPAAALPPGWRRVWHATPGKRGGYATFVGPNGRHARSVSQAQALAVAPLSLWTIWPTTSHGSTALPPAALVPRAASLDLGYISTASSMFAG